MTLPAAFPLSMSQIANELGLSFPLAFSHSWIVQLAQKPGFPMSFSDLLGKTGRFDGSLFCSSGGGGQTINFGNAPWFGGQLQSAGQLVTAPSTSIGFTTTPNWSGNILLRNNTTGAGVVMPRTNTNVWSVATTVGFLFRSGQTDNFTLLPSS